MTDEAADVLDIQLAYWRAELEVHQHRLERANTRAAGLIAAALALGGATATVLAALHRSLPFAAIVCLVLGGVCTMAGAFAGIMAADTADEPKWGWKLVLHLPKHSEHLQPDAASGEVVDGVDHSDTTPKAADTADEPKWGWKHPATTLKVLKDRKAMHALMPSTAKTDPVLARRAIVESLETRARAAARVASYTNDQVWLVSVLVLTGVILLAATVAVVVA
jgi:hypothetical protein